ncbi:MAG: transposase [Deltaproteobacteria bacterium]
MPRTARVLEDESYYHIFTRGNDRKLIFRKSVDYKFLLETIMHYQAKYNVGIVHYCLMPNHIHFMLKAERGDDLPKFMQVVLQVYADFFKRRYNSVGYLFQNRYKSILIENEAYLLECARYIERNPIRAKMVSDPAAFRWSSYDCYAYGKEDPVIKYVNPLYLYLDNDQGKRMELYRKIFLEERLYETLVDEAFKIT